MLNFWATWCPPCKREIPDFVELQKKYGAKGLKIVGIALDKPESVMEFLREQPLNYTVLLGNNDVSGMFGNIESIPTTFLIDREGIVRSVKVGLESKEAWVALIQKYL
jgi:cytochrome c biogenesis protein CcmG/thiol:disulfide interchange protein DsbE